MILKWGGGNSSYGLKYFFLNKEETIFSLVLNKLKAHHLLQLSLDNQLQLPLCDHRVQVPEELQQRPFQDIFHRHKLQDLLRSIRVQQRVHVLIQPLQVLENRVWETLIAGT
ncbi:UNVERIFIED_CONTAM: hypothetical protein K2H54_068220 [Gekko kuhli]